MELTAQTSDRRRTRIADQAGRATAAANCLIWPSVAFADGRYLQVTRLSGCIRGRSLSSGWQDESLALASFSKQARRVLKLRDCTIDLDLSNKLIRIRRGRMANFSSNYWQPRHPTSIGSGDNTLSVPRRDQTEACLRRGSAQRCHVWTGPWEAKHGSQEQHAGAKGYRCGQIRLVVDKLTPTRIPV